MTQGLDSASLPQSSPFESKTVKPASVCRMFAWHGFQAVGITVLVAWNEWSPCLALLQVIPLGIFGALGVPWSMCNCPGLLEDPFASSSHFFSSYLNVLNEGIAKWLKG